MAKSKIEWTEKVWNVVTGCTKVSPGCRNCYAERLFPRVYGNDTIEYYPKDKRKIMYRPRKFTDVKIHHDRLEQPLRWKKPSMIFVCSMGDLFHEDVPFDFIDSVFNNIFNSNKEHVWQILTKRPTRMRDFFATNHRSTLMHRNVWLGVSVENQKTADERIPILLETPAKVRWVSVEPMFEIINLWPYLHLHKLDWVVVGAESGPNRRPCYQPWMIDIVDQCRDAGVKVFVKQIHTGMDCKLERDISKFPEFLQVREYPI